MFNCPCVWCPASAYLENMKTVCGLLAGFALLVQVGLAAPRQHTVGFGKWTTIKWMVGEDEHTAIELKIRPLLVDGQIKEFAVGSPHEVTDRTFVVQRVFRSNDSLPQETGAPRWRWERGGWLLVNRLSGKMQQIPLPEFDPYSSTAAWFRDYAAYCGVSDDGKKVSAIIVQLSRRKPLLKKLVGDAVAAMPDSECPAPLWQRAPPRVTFEPNGQPTFTFTLTTRAVDVVTEKDNEDDDAGDE